MRGLEIRSFRPGDEEAINAGFNRVFGLQRALEEWRWKFAEAPFGRFILIATLDGEIIAQYATIPVRVAVDGGTFVAGQVVDIYNAKRVGMARRGIFVQLVERYYEIFGGAGNLDLIYGFAGERHSRLGVRLLRYSEALPVPFWRRDAGVALPPGGRAHSVSQGFDPASIDDLWARARLRYPVAAVRDSQWVGRRFTGRPGVDYLHLGAWREGRLEAYGVLRLAAPVVSWAELVWDGSDPEAVAALDEEVARRVVAVGAERSELWLKNDPDVEALLARRGWRREKCPGNPLQSAVSFAPSVLDALDFCRHLYVTMGDADLI